jgi:hypothetical protein
MKTYDIYTTSTCYTTYRVEAESKEEAIKKYEEGDSNPIGEEFQDEKIEVVEEQETRKEKKH